MTKSKQHEAVMLAVVEAIRDKRRTIYLSPEMQREIAEIGGVWAWIKLTETRRKLFKKMMAKVAPEMTTEGEVKIVAKQREWPPALQSTVQGYKQHPQMYSVWPGPLSAGTPGNEETDPGPQSSDW